jgi:hypothetical protein
MVPILLIIFTKNHELIETITQTRDHIIQLFALFTFSSSPPDIKYITPLIINVITAIIDTYCKSVETIFTKNSAALLLLPSLFSVAGLGDLISVSIQPGIQKQLIVGILAVVVAGGVHAANTFCIKSNSVP